MKDTEYLTKLNAYWRAANFLSATQLYLLDNPLLREHLKHEHIKKKIVGHWGTVPGQNFIYCHMNRAIKKYDLNMILVSGPGHGGNFFVSNSLDIPSVRVSDGPNGLRKEKESAGTNVMKPAETATCFPPSATTASSCLQIKI